MSFSARSFVATLIVACVIASPATAAERDKLDAKQLAALVRQLGDEDYARRENASQKLIRVGMPAAAALEKGVRDPDREIRYRSKRILVLIRDVDFRNRLQAFIRDVGGKKKFHLPAWKPFRKQFGDTPKVRELFVQMQKAEPELMQAIEDGGSSTKNVFRLRVEQLQQSIRSFRLEMSLGNFASLLFAAADESVEVEAQTASLLNSFCYQPVFRREVVGGEYKDELRRMLGGWIRRGEDWSAYQGMTMARQYELKEGLVPAERVLRSASNQVHIRQFAVLTIAKLGDRSHIPLLETMLEDPTPCSSQRIRVGSKSLRYETQIRDVALASILHLAKADLKTFGFGDQVRKDPQSVYAPNTLGFPSLEERTEAFQKWAKYRAEHPKLEKEKP